MGCVSLPPLPFSLSLPLLSFFFLFLFGGGGEGAPLRAVIHIGPPKTGTTSIQHVLATYSSLALSKDNISVYPKKTTDENHDVARWFARKSKYHHHDSYFKQISLRETNWLISSEFLFILNQSEIEGMKEKLTGYNVTIVTFFRNPLDHLRSIWEQWSCLNGPSTLIDYLNQTTKNLFNHRLDDAKRNFLATLDMYREVFGKDNVIVVDFDGAAERGISPAEIIGNIAQTDIYQGKTIPKLNVRASMVTPLHVYGAIFKKPPLNRKNCRSMPDLKLRVIINFLENGNFLQDCGELIDFDELNDKLQLFYERGFKERGVEVLYGKKEGERRGYEKIECQVVREGGVEAWERRVRV